MTTSGKAEITDDDNIDNDNEENEVIETMRGTMFDKVFKC